MLIDPTLRTIHPNLNEYFKTDALSFMPQLLLTA